MLKPDVGATTGLGRLGVGVIVIARIFELGVGVKADVDKDTGTSVGDDFEASLEVSNVDVIIGIRVVIKIKLVGLGRIDTSESGLGRVVSVTKDAVTFTLDKGTGSSIRFESMLFFSAIFGTSIMFGVGLGASKYP